jgi:ferredoxin hydrogenase
MDAQNQSTRREFLKAATLGAGLFVAGEQSGVAQPWGGRGQQQGQGQQGQQRSGRGQREPLPILPSNPSIQHHRNRCRNCGRCREFCRTTTNIFGQVVPPGEDACIRCGQCTHYCTRAITEKYHYPAVGQAVADPKKIVVASTSPAIRVALGEMYRLAPGTNVEGKTVGALKQFGIDHVLDVTFSADLTVMEEASELLQRLETNTPNNPLPMFTSCCPGWTRFVKLFYPGLLPNLSTVKSPVMIQGTLVKTYFAQKMGIDPTSIVHVALTPCTAKKMEILLPFGTSPSGLRYVDIALTCREIALMLNERNVHFLQTQDAPYSSLMGTGSGAGIIFGNTGGVMEATLRTAYKILNGTNPPAEFLSLRPVRSLAHIRQAAIDLGKRQVNVAIVHGISNVRPLLEAIRNGTQSFDFVEVMACPGGCIGGGGQPIVPSANAALARQQRINALYERDVNRNVRLSYDNPDIQTIYHEFLGEPLSKKSLTLLHSNKSG